MSNILEVAKQTKARSQASDLRPIANKTTYTEFFKPRLEEIENHYYGLLVQATLSSENIEVIDPLTGVTGTVSPRDLAARIEGIRFAKDLLKKLIKEVEKNEVKVNVD